MTTKKGVGMGLKEIFSCYRKSVYIGVLIFLVLVLAFLSYQNYRLAHCQWDFSYGTETYDLIWVEKSLQGGEVWHKWRCFLRPDSLSQPIVIEKYSRDVASDYVLEGTLIIRSSIEQIRSAVKDAGFGGSGK